MIAININIYHIKEEDSKKKVRTKMKPDSVSLCYLARKTKIVYISLIQRHTDIYNSRR